LRIASGMVTACEFDSNGAGAVLNAYGGAVSAGATTFQSCTFRSNQVAFPTYGIGYGGALALSGSNTVSNCVFVGNVAYGYGGAIYSTGVNTMSGCIFVNNTGYGGAINAAGGAVENCTLIGNSGNLAGRTSGLGGIGLYQSGTVRATIIVGTTGRPCEGSASQTWSCCDLFDNPQGNTPCGIDRGGNFSADPQFCATDPATSLNVMIQSDSPCAPGNHPNGNACGLIGAGPVSCGTVSVQQRTWTEVKSLYR